MVTFYIHARFRKGEGGKVREELFGPFFSHDEAEATLINAGWLSSKRGSKTETYWALSGTGWHTATIYTLKHDINDPADLPRLPVKAGGGISD